MWPLIIIVFVALGAGLTAIEGGQVRATSPDIEVMKSEAGGSAFMAYRSAVVRYSEQNASFRGAVPASALPWPAGLAPNTAPPGAANEILNGPNGERIVCAWATVGNGTVARLATALGGDATIGESNGTEWSAPGYGVMGPLPVSVPAGDIVSVVELGN